MFHQLVDGDLPMSCRSRVRERLIAEFLPVAERIARKYRNRGPGLEDLIQVARIGLINAVDRFDPDRGSDFLSFAVPTITGEVRRYFRDNTWAVRVPRRLQELHAAITRCTGQLVQDLGRAPRPSELAARLGIPVEEVCEGLLAGYAYTVVPLDPGPDAEPGRADDVPGEIDEGLALVENRAALYPALAALPKREASIVVMRFFDDLTQSQIAQRIGCSQMHVSRLLSATLAELRETLTS